MLPVIELTSLSTLPSRGQIKCLSCALNKLCLPMGLDETETGLLDRIIGRRRRVDRDENLFRMEDSFKNLYAVRFGHFKTFRINPSGGQQVVGFQMAGDLMGLDAIGAQRHQSAAVALEDSEVCEIPFARLEELSAEVPHLQRHFNRMMSHEITREQSVMLFLGGMRAEQRFAVFLMNLSVRYAARGYSPARFQLRMSREDIGNYLGLTIESVSRLLLKFKQKGWLQVDKRAIEIIDRPCIEALASGLAAAEPIAGKRPQPGAAMRPAQQDRVAA